MNVYARVTQNGHRKEAEESRQFGTDTRSEVSVSPLKAAGVECGFGSAKWGRYTLHPG